MSYHIKKYSDAQKKMLVVTAYDLFFQAYAKLMDADARDEAAELMNAASDYLEEFINGEYIHCPRPSYARHTWSIYAIQHADDFAITLALVANDEGAQ